MKFFIAFSLLVAVATAAPQFLVDTPDVSAAKQQFFAAYNAAYAQSASAPVQVAEADSVAAPAALPYIHNEVDAEPYVHVEIPAEPYIHDESDNSAAVQPENNQVYINNPVFEPQAPVQQIAYSGTCYNWRGEGVPCRTNFAQ